MIEISHAQARRWLSQSLDRHIPEGQWSALQGHLENCVECRAYRDRRIRLENDLRRGLRAGWSPIGHPHGLGETILAARRARETRRRAGIRAGLGLAVLISLVFWLLNQPEPQDEMVASEEGSQMAAAGVTATPAPSPTPVYDGDFRGVLAFEAPAEDGQPVAASASTNSQRPAQPGDIFLLALNTGSAELTNLTAHPARDFSPAWSPDGNWLAFLSERERDGGADIYIVSVAGTGLKRLTSDPDLAWSGPLAWSPDGSWIAASGTATGAESRQERRIYQIDTEGVRSPRELPGSSGGYNPRFAPNRPILAFTVQEGELTFLRAYYDDSGQTRDLTRHSAQLKSASGEIIMGVSAYDWTADGDEILYLSRQIDPLVEPSTTLVRVVRVLDVESGGIPQTGPAADAEGAADLPAPSRLLASFPGTAPVVSATLSADGQLFFTRSYRRFGQGTRCRPLSTPYDGFSSRRSKLLPALCVEGGLDRASWTSDGRWMVVAARDAHDDGSPGIYALNLPGSEGSSRARTERLADLPAGAGTPRVRPAGSQTGLISGSTAWGPGFLD